MWFVVRKLFIPLPFYFLFTSMLSCRGARSLSVLAVLLGAACVPTAFATVIDDGSQCRGLRDHTTLPEDVECSVGTVASCDGSLVAVGGKVRCH